MNSITMALAGAAPGVLAPVAVRTRQVSLRMVVAVVVAALVLAGCGTGGDNPASVAGADGGAGPVVAKEVVIAISGDEGTLTPYTQNSGYPGSNLVALVYDKLLELDKDNKPQPLLASKLETAPDSSSFTLTLRDGVKWQDGRPFTAQDVLFSVGYYQKHANADSAPQLKDLKNVTADRNKVTFTLKSPDPEFPSRLLADMRILPQHIWDKIKDPETATAKQAIGTGPFKLVSYKKDQGYELVANPDYAMGKPKIDKIKIKVIPQPQTALAGLRTGEVSMFSGTVPEEQASSLEKQRGAKVVRGPGFTSTLLAFNNQRAPFDNAKVRTAIADAIDTPKLVGTVLRGRGVVGSAGFWHPKAPGATMIEKPYDVSKANALLDEVGATAGADGIRVLDGKPMKFDLLVQASNPARIRTAELVRDMLKVVGIVVSIQSMDSDSLDAKVWPDYDVSHGRNYDMTMWGWSAPVMLDSTKLPSLVDSDTVLGRLNITGTKDPEMDRLSDQLRATTTQAARREVLGQLEKQVAQKMPFVTLYYPDGAFAYRQDVFDGWVYQVGSGLMNKMSFVDLSG